MLFTLTRDQYQKYKDIAGPCRQFILDKFPKLCSITDTFNRYFGAENVDIYGDGFKEKSLLLTIMEDYEERYKLVQRSLEEYFDNEFDACPRTGLFGDLAIYVRWPAVTVTNEREQSVVVRGLYAKVPLWPNGKLYEPFMLSRSTYTYEQYTSDYMHSHVQGIYEDPSHFMRPCLGTGPLIRTQSTLSSDSDSGLWDLFCVELDRYVHVESIAGVPYRYLNKIGASSLNELDYSGYRRENFRCINDSQDMKTLFIPFFKYVLAKKKMKFGFSGNYYTSALTETEWILNLSSEFLKYFALMTRLGRTTITQNRLLQDRLLIEVKLNNDKLYILGSNRRGRHNYRAFRDKHVLYFKGEDIRTTVDEPVNYSENTYYVLNPVLALTFLEQCLNYLNIYEHEKSKNVIQEETESLSRNSHDSSARSTVKNSFPDYPIGEKRVAVSL